MALAVLMLLAGPASIYGWTLTGNLLPWGVVIALYAVAKVLELADHQVWELTGHIVSGHSLKHVVASLAAWPVLNALHAAQCQRKPARTAR